MYQPTVYQTQPNMAGYGQYQSNVTVRSLVLQESGTYNPQYRMPYESQITAQTTMDLSKAAGEAGHGIGKLLPHMAMAIAPSASLAQEATIANGWFTRRFRFTLTVEVVNHTGIRETETITGYTEFHDTSYSGHVDPNMVFTINSTIKARMTADGGYYSDSSIVIPGATDLKATKALWKQRPEDVIAGMDNSIYADLDLASVRTVDRRNQLQSNPIIAKRAEQVPTLFLGSIIQAVTASRAAASVDVGTSDGEIFSTAQAALRNSYAGSGGLMQALSRTRQHATNEFTLNDLIGLDPNVLNLLVLIPLDAKAAASLHQVGQTAYMDTSPECLAATVIAQSVVSCMARSGMVVVRFTMDNLSEVVADARYVQREADRHIIASRVESFIHLFRVEVYNNVSYNGQIGCIVTVDADTHGDVVVGISLNGQGMMYYTMPAFCDAATTPLVTQDQAAMGRLVTDVGLIVDNVSHL